MIIVGVGIVASMRLFAACTDENGAGVQMTTAMMLASNVREAMEGLSFCDPITNHQTFGPEPGETLATFNDMDDFDGQTLNPPIDSLRNKIPQMSQYTQVISVMPVFLNQLNSNTSESAPTIVKTTVTNALRVRVRVLYQRRPSDTATEVYRMSWIRVGN